jgi:gamma-glutamyltranspeptidase
VLGSPGSPRIITAVLLTLTNIIDFGLAPRMPCGRAFITNFYRIRFLRARRIFSDTLAARRARPSPYRAIAVGRSRLIAIGPDGVQAAASQVNVTAGRVGGGN